MPRLNRSVYNGIICHHMVQGINRENIFGTKKEKEKYIKLVKQYYISFKIDIIAYCIMNNHAHFLLYSENISNISLFMKQVNLNYAIYYNKKKKRVGYVFRNRFQTKPILSQEQLYLCINYIHKNPVKAKIVEEEKEYKYSSYKDYLNESEFLNQKIFKSIFPENIKYINLLKLIDNKGMDFKETKKNSSIEEILRGFLKDETNEIGYLQKDKIFIQKFIKYLIQNKYQFSKKELAEFFNISIATLYRKIKIAKECEEYEKYKK